MQLQVSEHNESLLNDSRDIVGEIWSFKLSPNKSYNNFYSTAFTERFYWKVSFNKKN